MISFKKMLNIKTYDVLRILHWLFWSHSQHFWQFPGEREPSPARDPVETGQDELKCRQRVLKQYEISCTIKQWVVFNPGVCVCGSHCSLFPILISSRLGPSDLAFIVLTCSNRGDFCHFCFVPIYHFALTRFVTQIVVSSQLPQRLAPFSFPNSDWYFSFVSRS